MKKLQLAIFSWIGEDLINCLHYLFISFIEALFTFVLCLIFLQTIKGTVPKFIIYFYQNFTLPAYFSDNS